MEIYEFNNTIEDKKCSLTNSEKAIKRSISPDLFTDKISDDLIDSFIQTEINNEFVNNDIDTRQKQSLENWILLTLQENSKKRKINHKTLPSPSKGSEKLTTEVNLENNFYGLPHGVKNLFEIHQGIKELYAWQDEVLRLPAIHNRENLIFSLPTSGGKTLIAEILLLKELLCHKMDAILILPYISIVQEKVRELSPFAVNLDFSIEEYANNKGQFPPRKKKRKTVYIATIEKGHSLINSLIENKRVEEIGMVIVDELHMLGESSNRGATLENTLSKILYLNVDIQIIGMSATLNNVEELGKFLKATLYTGNFRPVELKEFVKLEDNILEINLKANDIEEMFVFSRKFKFENSQCPRLKSADPDQVTGLVLEVVPDNSCLVFCASKKNCENVATLISNGMPDEIKLVKSNEKQQLLTALKDGGRICKILRSTIPFGVAYHHSGLTMDERRLLEDAYANNILCCLTCTSTLAAGVNLPAKRVILRAPYVGREFLTRSRYKQMVGRAGRAGIDSSGESILIIRACDKEKVVELFTLQEEKCLSNLLGDEKKGIKSLILSLIGLEITKTFSDIAQFLSGTLLAVQQKYFGVNLIDLRDEILNDLINCGLIKAMYNQNCRNIEDAVLKVTDLGRATFKSSVDVDLASKLESDLTRGLNGLVLHNCLHLLCLVTPYGSSNGIKRDTVIYQNKFLDLNPEELLVANSIGIKMSSVIRMSCNDKFKNEEIVDRFYLSLILYELYRKKNIWDVSSEFNLHRGTIQNLFTNAISFASCVQLFCKELSKFWQYDQLLGNFIKPFSYCVTAELLPLMELPAVKKGRAMQLHKNGYKTLKDIAKANPNELSSSVPFMPRRVAKQIITTAQMLLLQKAEELRDLAEDLVDLKKSN